MKMENGKQKDTQYNQTNSNSKTKSNLKFNEVKQERKKIMEKDQLLEEKTRQKTSTKHVPIYIITTAFSRP